jgi:hypothetical protein
MVSRDKFIEIQTDYLDKYFGLVQGEGEARVFFERLAIDTYDCIGGFWREPDRYTLEADSRLPEHLRERWRIWKHQYRRLLERNPVLELYEMLGDIGESHIFSPWPHGLAWDVLDWVEKGDRYLLPFDDRKGIATLEFYARLCEVRRLAKGWLYWDESKDRVVFVPNEEIEQFRWDLLVAQERSDMRIYGDAWESQRLSVTVTRDSAKAKAIAERRRRLLAEEASKAAKGARKREH